MKKLTLNIFIIFLIASCSVKKHEGSVNNSENESESNSFVDTSPYQFELAESSADTFKLVSHDDYFYYCFGQFSNPDEFKVYYNDKFQVTKEKTCVYNDTTNIDTLYRIIIDKGFLKYLFNEKEKKMHLVSGRITSPQIPMTNGIKVGLSKEIFNQKLFGQNFPPRIYNYNNIQIETALKGIWITFSFKQNILSTISIDTDFQIDKK